MPHEPSKEKINIYNKVIIVLNDDTSFDIINTIINIHVASHISDSRTALLIKKAYCDGFVDGNGISRG